MADAARTPALRDLDGAPLLGERAMLGGFRVPGRVSAGGGCRLYETANGTIALNLSRESDRDLLPALLECEIGDPEHAPNLNPARSLRAGSSLSRTDGREASPSTLDAPSRQARRPVEPNGSDPWFDALTAAMRGADGMALVARGRLMGMAIAGEDEPPGAPAVTPMIVTAPVTPPARPPRVLDLSALWAGPLAGHLLALAGADVLKVESRTRPDAMRDGDSGLFALLNQGKAQAILDFGTNEGRAALLSLIENADIVIEASRPRALLQLGIDADAIVSARPGLCWLSITGHGATGEAANWIGFGDDCGVAAGLSAALRRAYGRSGFVGDAIGDPLTGIRAAALAWQGWSSGRGGRFSISMRGVVTEAMSHARDLPDQLRRWAAMEGQSFRPVQAEPAQAATNQPPFVSSEVEATPIPLSPEANHGDTVPYIRQRKPLPPRAAIAFGDQPIVRVEQRRDTVARDSFSTSLEANGESAIPPHNHGRPPC